MDQSTGGTPATGPAETLDWLAPQEQQFWFDRFAVAVARTQANGRPEGAQDEPRVGLRFQQFQEFLGATLYPYFGKISATDADDNANSNADLAGALGQLDLGTKLGEPADAAQAHSFTKQQEMLLFKRFDANNDHLIDRDEFAALCQLWLQRVFRPTCALVVVDVQNDFIDGSLALINGPAGQDGAEVVPVINELVGVCVRHGVAVVYTQDWHPQDHLSFLDNLHLRKHQLRDANEQQQQRQDEANEAAHGTSGRPAATQSGHSNGATQAALSEGQAAEENNEFKYKKFVSKVKMFDTVLFDEGRVEQKLWPTHCVSNSWGAQLHPKLRVAPESVRIQKGTLSHVDAYSAFWDNMRSNETGLRQELAAKGVTDLFFCGLALDYCVAASALDATKAGFVTFVVEDACRGIDLDEIERRKRELREHGAFLVQSNMAGAYLSRDLGSGPDSAGQGRSLCSSRNLITTITYRKAFS